MPDEGRSTAGNAVAFNPSCFVSDRVDGLFGANAWDAGLSHKDANDNEIADILGPLYQQERGSR